MRKIFKARRFFNKAVMLNYLLLINKLNSLLWRNCFPKNKKRQKLMSWINYFLQQIRQQIRSRLHNLNLSLFWKNYFLTAKWKNQLQTAKWKNRFQSTKERNPLLTAKWRNLFQSVKWRNLFQSTKERIPLLAAKWRNPFKLAKLMNLCLVTKVNNWLAKTNLHRSLSQQMLLPHKKSQMNIHRAIPLPILTFILQRAGTLMISLQFLLILIKTL